MRRIWMSLLLLLSIAAPAAAQDGLNLPSELYVLLNSGSVERYGLGAEGVRTVTPEGQFVLDMGVAPDGNWLAFRTDQGLSLVDMFTGETSQVEGASATYPPVRGRGDTMAWSPAGDALVYATPYGARVYFDTDSGVVFVDIATTQLINLIWSPDGSYLAAESENNIWWIFRREGTQMTLHSAIASSIGITWTSGSQLVFAPESGGLIAMDLANANAQTALQNEGTLYRLPSYRPDGTLLVYARRKNDASVEDGMGRLTRINLSDGRAEDIAEAPVNLAGARWAPGGALLVAFQGGALALVGPLNGAGLPLPITSAVAYTWGALPAERVTGVNLPLDGFLLADDADGVAQVWRLPRDGTPPAPVTAAPASVTDFAVAPDRHNLAYFSGGTLWSLAFSGETEPLALVELGAGAVPQFSFAPDSQTVVYAVNGGETSSAGLWRVAITGGEPERILTPREGAPPVQYANPRFAPNVNALLVRVVSSDSAVASLFDPASGEITLLDGYGDGVWLRDGRVVAYYTAAPGVQPTDNGLWLVSPNNLDQPPVQLMALPAGWALRSLVEMGSGQLRILLGKDKPGPSHLRVVDVPLAGGGMTEVAEVGYVANPRLSPDGQLIVGYAHAGGPLLIHNLETGARVILTYPVSVRNFDWSPG